MSDWLHDETGNVRKPTMGVSFLLQAPDGSGGFLGAKHIVGWRRPVAASETGGEPR